jgi:hypothetical protein
MKTLTTFALLFCATSAAIAQAPPLRIVIVEGEDAVNVIQQKSAVAPVIEVRDRNDQPVSGAIVKFAISKGRATFSGARALTVTTNTAGRAIAAGLTPTGSGALQISAAASFQGQTVVATIAQTNVMTAAAAGAAGGAGAGGGAGGTASAGGGAAAGGSGGVSATTLGIVGGAVAGGAVAAKEVIDATSVDVTLYNGPYSGSMVDVLSPPNPINDGCTRIESHSGTLPMHLETHSDGSVSKGHVDFSGTSTVVSFVTSACGPSTLGQTQADVCEMTLSGTKSNLQGSGGFTVPQNGVIFACTFSGAVQGNTVNGTATFTITAPAQGGHGSMTVQVTLNKQ